MVSSKNKEEVKKLLDLMEGKNVIGIVGIHGIPGTQMNNIRRSLRGNAELVVSKNTLISIALQDLEGKKKNVSELSKYLRDQSAIIVSDEDPFKLAKIVEASRTRAAPKGGEIAPEDVVVPAGETEFKPGPIVSDLQKVGIPASIEKGKVVIKKDTVVVRKGEKISRDLAQMLAKLDIRPIPVGLEIRAFYEDGYIFGSDALKIDTDKVMNDLRTSIMNAFNLSLNIGYFTRLTVPILISDAYMKALSLGINTNYFTQDTIKHLLARANLQAMAIKEKIGEI
ncbi:MAG: 50S ribosomal protein L10 [Thermoplasmata archaeon]